MDNFARYIDAVSMLCVSAAAKLDSLATHTLRMHAKKKNYAEMFTYLMKRMFKQKKTLFVTYFAWKIVQLAIKVYCDNREPPNFDAKNIRR